jgi:CubicO group peptidase (beta-lactamase class C family)
MKTKCLIPIRYIVAASLMLPITAKADPVFPGTEWEAATPESQGVDPARLAAFQQRAGGAGAIVRNGYMIDAWGSQNTHGSDWGSVVKSFCSTLLFFELNEGRIPGPYEPVRPYVQQQFPGRDLMAKDVPITFFHLANYTSGYALPEAPGEAWSHNDYANKLYLFLVYGLLEVDPRNSTQLNAAITTPERMGSLQFQDGQIVALRAGTPRLTTSIRDTARIAWFWANKGRWGDQQLLPRSFFNTYAKAQSYGIPRSSSHKPHDYLQIGTMGAPDPNSIPVDPSFGFGWKFNLLPNGALMFPGCPPDFFYCQGVNRFVVVVPSLNLVALWRDGAPISNPQKPAVFAQLCRIINPQ